MYPIQLSPFNCSTSLRVFKDNRRDANHIFLHGWKASLLAQGYFQILGIEFDRLLAVAGRPEFLYILVALAVH